MTLLSHDIDGYTPGGSGVEIRMSEFEDRIDWQVLFGNSGPVVVEAGSGKGRFIIRSALENPGINYVGIEKSGRYFRILCERVLKSRAGNIRLFWGEASYFLEQHVLQSSVSSYHIYFPDPWPKKRHRKRRLVNPCFMDILSLSLIPGGMVFFATDFEDYFDQMIEVSGSCRGLEKDFCKVILPQQADPEEALTSYERKYLIQGRQIYRAGYRKK